MKMTEEGPAAVLTIPGRDLFYRNMTNIRSRIRSQPIRMMQLLAVALLILVHFTMAPPSAVAQNSEGGPPPPPFVHNGTPIRRFEGFVGKLPVVMYLNLRHRTADGYYFYKKSGQPISLWSFDQNDTAHFPSTNDSIAISEFSDPGDTSMHVFRLHVSPDSLVGTWEGNQRKLSVALHEAYPNGTHGFDLISREDSIKFPIHKKFTGAVDESYRLIVPDDKMVSPFRTFFLSKIAEYLNCPTARGVGTIVRTLNEHMRNLLDTLKQGVLQDAEDAEDSDIANDIERFEYSESDGFGLRYNEHDLVVLDEWEASFYGGAHPNSSVSVHVLDLKNQKVLALSDITTADSVTLENLLEKYLRKEYHLAPTDSLSDLLFENFLAANSNFYVTDRGIGFVYNPYEVASYAVGYIEVFIPFSELKGKLTPWFLKRIAS